VGAGSITIVDTGAIEYSSIASDELGQPTCITGIRVHILTAGASFNLHTRKAAPPSEGKS
jgi:cyanophycinase